MRVPWGLGSFGEFSTTRSNIRIPRLSLDFLIIKKISLTIAGLPWLQLKSSKFPGFQDFPGTVRTLLCTKFGSNAMFISLHKNLIPKSYIKLLLTNQYAVKWLNNSYLLVWTNVGKHQILFYISYSK